MPRTAGSLLRIAFLWGLAIGGPCPTTLLGAARADTPVASDPDASPGKLVLPGPRSASETRRAGGPSGWWIGTTGIAAALALFGGAALAARRFLPRQDEGPIELRVLGRAGLSPKHAVALLRAGDRILIVGTGPQGPPALLGEWTAPEPSPGLDVRIGDDR